jgi:hypothetical protein
MASKRERERERECVCVCYVTAGTFTRLGLCRLPYDKALVSRVLSISVTNCDVWTVFSFSLPFYLSRVLLQSVM